MLYFKYHFVYLWQNRENEVEQNKNSLGRKRFITKMACGATWKKF